MSDHRNQAGPPDEGPLRVLLVDDETPVRQAVARSLSLLGFAVEPVDGGESALEMLGQKVFDVVLSDVSMPGMDGIQLFERVRSRGRKVPFVLLTGLPTLETAIRAVELGAYRYLTKPFEVAQLVQTLREAGTLYRASRHRTDTGSGPGNLRSVTQQLGLEPAISRALSRLWLARQPIVHTNTGAILAYELLVRSDDEELRTPGQLIPAAEIMGQVRRLGREVRRLAAEIAVVTPPGVLLFVNLHPEELLDSELYDPASPLAAHASRVVLEVTERSALTAVQTLREDIAKLRRLGYRLAVDDLGAGYSSLNSVAELAPEFVKIDMSLTRGVEGDSVRRRLIQTIVTLAQELDSGVVAEGIETDAEHQVMVDLDVAYLQGYLLGRPERAIVSAAGGTT